MIPESYREVENKCRDCQHCFVRGEHDAPNQYFCHFDKSDRPLCGSQMEGESFFDREIKDKELRYANCDVLEKLWDAWAETHRVDASGTCNEFKRI